MMRPRHTLAAVLPGLPDAAAACTPCKCFPNPSTRRPSSCLQDQIKAHITDLMLSAPPRVRAQLSEALSIISSHDFPAKWQVGVKGYMQHGAGAGWGGWLAAAEGAWKVLRGAADAASCCCCVFVAPARPRQPRAKNINQRPLVTHGCHPAASSQSLLPHLVEKMGSADPQLVNGVLSTADSIYQRYRCVAPL